MLSFVMPNVFFYKCSYADCLHAECHIVLTIMLDVNLDVIMLNVVAP
jgi:hypothetical protein